MGNTLRRVAVVTAAVTLTIGTASVWGGETDRGGFTLEMSTQTPGAPAGLSFHVLYKDPDDPEGKPPPVTGAVFELPEGLVIDDEAVPQCTASDEEFRMHGRDACPAESRVGSGTLIAMTGFPGVDPVETDVVAFNGDGELVEVVFFKDTNVVAGMDRLTIEGSTLVAHPPATPGGPPDGRTAVREIRLDVPARVGTDGRAYVTAPPDCPAGRWTSTAHYEFEDGGSTVVTSESPCEPTARPALRVRATPRRARARKPKTFRVAVTSSDPDCIDGARVRLGKARGRTDADGRARVRTKFRRAGVKRVRVAKKGCRPGRAAIRVRPPKKR